MTPGAIVIRRRDPAAVAARAHAVLDAAARSHAQWPPEGRKAIGEAFTVLGTALEEYRALADGSAHWEQLYPHLATEADPHQAALEKAAEETACAVAALLAVTAASRGTGAAGEMNNAAGDM